MPTRTSTQLKRSLLFLVVTIFGGCQRGTNSDTSPAAVGEGLGRFQRIASATPVPEDTLSVAEALRGVEADTGSASFGERMPPRRIQVPHPPRGATSRFNFGEGRRGWITAMPSAELLTSPAFHQGRVFLGGGFASHRFYAFNAYNGELDWSVAAPDGGPTAAIIEDGKVIFNTESCTIFVADAASGQLLWSRWLGDPLMSQPAAANGLVFSAYPTSGGHLFGAFRLSDGEPVWTTPIAADVIQAPQVVGHNVYFATMDGTVYRLDSRTGNVRWSENIGASSAVWVSGEKALLARRVPGAGAPREQLVALNTSSGRIEHRGDVHQAGYLAGGSRDRTLAAGTSGAWGNATGAEHLGLANVASGWAFQGSTPAVSAGRAYFSIAGDVVAHDVSTAQTVWRREYTEAEGAQALSPPTVVGSLVLVGTVDGQLLATDIDTGMTVWAYDVGEPLVFQPIVAQGWVYLATGRGNVIGLEVGDALLDGWHMWGGNAQHAGLVETAGEIDPRLLASLAVPGRGTLQAVHSAPTSEDSDSEDADGEQVERESPTAQAEEHERDLPLRATEVDGRISGRVAEVFVTQRFQNDGPEPIEAVYLFPLPADAAVDQMEMRIGDRIIRGVIRGRSEARQEYEAARSEGRRAALLEQQRPNLFAQRVANIGPGETIDVRLRYVQTLPFENGQYSLTFPMVANRRYDSGTRHDSMATASTAAATSPLVAEQPPVTLRFEVAPGLPIMGMSSPTHSITPGRDGTSRATITLNATGEQTSRDFVLNYAVSGERPQAALLSHRTDDQGYFSLLIQPPSMSTDQTIVPRDITFVVDTSSSMHGRPLDQARMTIRHVIEGLRDSDRFNIIGFADHPVSLHQAPALKSASSVEEANRFLDGLVSAGATEMVPAIAQALATPVTPGRLSILVLVTDGYIAHEDTVLRTIATSVGEHRFYALGMGSSPNHFLIDRVAEIGRARPLVAPLSEEPATTARRFASLIDRPVFTDVRIDWGGLDVSDVYPRRLPDLFAEQPIVVYGRFARGGNATVRIRGNIGTDRFERVINVVLPNAATPDGLHASQTTLWARAAIHERMTRLFFRDDEALIAEVRALGLAHHIVTPWTSFVAIEERAQPEAPSAAGEAEPEAHATVSPARALPGDPEIRIPAPINARDVTVILPFGESISAVWESAHSIWSARFLIPRDADEGTYPIEVLITHEDGHLEHLRLWYTVDASAALVRLEVEGAPRPGQEITISATQVITQADLAQVGRDPGELTGTRALLLTDARRVEARTPSGDVIEFRPSGPGTWQATWRVPQDATSNIDLDVIVVDLAANVSHQTLHIEVQQ